MVDKKQKKEKVPKTAEKENEELAAAKKADMVVE